MTLAIDGLQSVLHEILDAHPTGMSEYELLKALSRHNIKLFNEEYFNSPIGLFQRHFLLFHCLYQLRNTMRLSLQGDMTIHCLSTQIIPYSNSPSDYPAQADTLAYYYLDLENLTSTDESDVLELIDNFWKKLVGEDQRDEALSVMQLTHPTDYPAVKQQYRRLAMQWHPDRGGESTQFHRLEWAMGVLNILYR